MNDVRFEIKPEDMQAYLDQANKLRAEALREGFVELKGTVAGFVAKVGHVLHIPRTRQL